MNGIVYMGKVGDTLKYFQGCSADFSVKMCFCSTYWITNAVDSNTMRKMLVSLQSDTDSTKHLWSCWNGYCCMQWRWIRSYLEKLVISILFSRLKISVNIKPCHWIKNHTITLLFPIVAPCLLLHLGEIHQNFIHKWSYVV